MTEAKKSGEKLRQIQSAMVDLDADGLQALIREGLSSGIEAVRITEALTDGIRVVGDKFEAMEYFLPQLMKGAAIMENAMAIVRPEIERLDLDVQPAGTIVLATIEGDIHDIGRNIVGAMLRASGFAVHDLGHDVKAETIVDSALSCKADVIGLSALITTSLPYAGDVFRLLEQRGLRDEFKVTMGGGAVTPEYSERLGADGYGGDAAAAVKLMRELLAGR